jgi:hypothetical protein
LWGHYSFRRLFDKQGSVASNEELERRFFKGDNYLASPDDFKKLPGDVIAYWITNEERRAFAESQRFGTLTEAKQWLATANDPRFLRLWHEVGLTSIGFGMKSREEATQSGKKWFPLIKGGPFRRWYGNIEYLVNWHQDGHEIRNFFGGTSKLKSRPQNMRVNLDLWYPGPPTRGGHPYGSFTLRRSTDAPDRGARFDQSHRE